MPGEDTIVVWAPSEEELDPDLRLAAAVQHLAPAIRRHYEPMTRFGQIEVWRKKAAKDPAALNPDASRPGRAASSRQRRLLVMTEEVGRIAVDRHAPRLAELRLGPAAAEMPPSPPRFTPGCMR